MRLARCFSVLAVIAVLVGLVPQAPVVAAPTLQTAPGYANAIQALVPGGRIISVWGDCRDGCSRKHEGVDVAAPIGSPIYAIEPGVVTVSGWNGLGGNSLSYRDDSGRRWYFAHFPEPSPLRAGQRITAGALVGRVGVSGNAQGTVPHLHFQVSKPGGDWADPAVVLAKWAGSGAASAMEGSGPWYRYQGEPSSFDSFKNQTLNSGPTTAAMAIQYARNISVPVREVRAFIGKNGDGVDAGDIASVLEEWDVEHKAGLADTDDLRDVISRGNVAIIALDMGEISEGEDVEGASADPEIREGRYYKDTDSRWLAIKGVTSDGRYFKVYDSNVWGKPGAEEYWYSDNTPKGLDRLYLASEVERAIIADTGIEILTPRQPQVSYGERIKAKATYYTLSEEETDKTPDDPEWGVMYNGDYVHWGAVAVDPEFIPLGTHMKIDGWGDQLFVAKDIGEGVEGYQVALFWPGTKDQAGKLAAEKGGSRGVTLIDPSAQFTDAVQGEGPSGARITVADRDGKGSHWVTLELAAEDPQDVVGMMISNNEYFTDAFEEPYAARKRWTLSPGDGVKRVFARFKNKAGAWSEPVSTFVVVNDVPPAGSVIVAPDPRVVLSAPLSGHPNPSIGEKPKASGRLQYRPLGPNLLRNSSFEAWAGGVPQNWDTELKDDVSRAYDPWTRPYHGALAVKGVAGEQEEENALTQKVMIKPDTEYTLSAWVLGAGGILELEEFETKGMKSVDLSAHAATSEELTGWQQVSVSFRASESATDATVRLSGSVAWDAVQLEEGKLPTPYRADGVLLEGPATNHIPNSSLEIDEKGWTSINNVTEVVASPDYARFGRSALLVRKEQAGRAATFSPATLTPGKSYTYSVYARQAGGQPVTDDLLRGWFSQGSHDPEDVDTRELTDENRPPMVWEPAGGGWYRGHYTFKATKKLGIYGVYSTDEIPVNGMYYLDGAQLEQGEVASSYVDGSLGGRYRWNGRPFESPSTREGASLVYGKTAGSQGSLMFWARPEGRAPADTTLLLLGNLRVRLLGSRAVLEAGGKTVAAATWEPGVAHAYAITWDGKIVTLWQDGRNMGTAAAPPPPPGSLLSLGPGEGHDYPSAMVGDLSLWRAALPATEVEHLAANSPLDAGQPTVTDRKTVVATSAVDAADGETEAEWSTDGEEWQEWDTAHGPHALDLGAEEGKKTIWVRYTDANGNALTYQDTVVLDLTPPEVGAVTARGGLLTLSFSEPVAPGSLGAVGVSSGGKRVLGSWSYTPGEKVATYALPVPTPKSLDVTVSEKLRDLAGNALAEPYRRSVAHGAIPAGTPPTQEPAGEPEADEGTTDDAAQPADEDPIVPVSLGIGMGRSEWEESHGAPEQEVGGYSYYEDGRYTISFAGAKVRHIERAWGEGDDAVTLTEAREVAQGLIPSDATLVDSYIPLQGRLVRVFESESLARRFSEEADGDVWGGAEPGRFTVLYRIEDGLVTSVAVDVGATE